MKGRSAFEWWYFDARFTDGHTFAAAIGNMKPKVNMHINSPDGKEESVMVNLPNSSYIASPDKCVVRCEQSHVHGACPVYEVDMFGDGAEAHLKFENMLPG